MDQKENLKKIAMMYLDVKENENKISDVNVKLLSQLNLFLCKISLQPFVSLKFLVTKRAINLYY